MQVQRLVVSSLHTTSRDAYRVRGQGVSGSVVLATRTANLRWDRRSRIFLAGSVAFRDQRQKPLLSSVRYLVTGPTSQRDCFQITTAYACGLLADSEMVRGHESQIDSKTGSLWGTRSSGAGTLCATNQYASTERIFQVVVAD